MESIIYIGVERSGQGGRAMILGVPWWVLAVILLIFFSGYMAFRAMVAERKLEQQNAEREGKIFIERMIKEKEQREKDRQQTS